MLFNSYIFLVVFLPITLGVYWLLGRWSTAARAKSWLVLASLFFYSWWNPPFAGLIIASVLFNFAVGGAIGRLYHARRKPGLRRALLLSGAGINLLAIAYYKYAGFLAVNLNHLFGTSIPVVDVFLPLGISFFTFQQVAYLADANRGMIRDQGLIDYALFVTFFPQLIAGPIVHHGDVLPQFARTSAYRMNRRYLSLGISILAMGLFKKVVVADGVARFASPVFLAASSGESLTFLEAWGGVMAYTFQLYFDFSGYSDMAIGLGWLFGIRLPLNFNSPYKAANIIDFWKRWHMTLSQFLRDYLYIPLGGNRKGTTRRYVNLMITMVLGGLWHGAGWTFVWWGGLHGAYLMINYAWQRICAGRGWSRDPQPAILRGASVALTFLAVVVGWVFFRAATFEAASSLLQSMFGARGVALPVEWGAALGSAAPWLSRLGVHFSGPLPHQLFPLTAFLWLALLQVTVWVLPNAIELCRAYRPAVLHRSPWERPSILPLRWRPTWVWGFAVAMMAIVSLLRLSEISEFLYFQF